MEFQSWKVNFKTEVCSTTAYPHLTMHRIKEVEMATSIDELMTTRSSVGRTDFPEFDMLDAMIASALKRLLDKHIHFRKRASVKEQRAQNTTDSYIKHKKNSGHFRATAAYEAVQGLSHLFSISLQNDGVQNFDVRCDHALLSACDMPTEMVMEG